MIKRFLLLLLLCVPAIAPCQTRIDPSNQVKGQLSYTAKSKPAVDVRDLGIDCTFATDSSAALNALTNVNDKIDGVWLAFPPGCHIKLGSTWTIKNQSAFRIGGWSGAGANGAASTGVPTITWTGAAGVTMIDMEYVDGFDVERLAIDGGGLAGTGINVDKSGAGGIVNTTDGIFDRIFVHASISGPGNANWVGIRLSAVSKANVEDMRITNSTFYCGGSSTSGQAAIQIGNSFNAKNFRIEYNNIHDCNRGVWQTQGQATIAHNEVGSNHTDFEIDYWTDPEQINYNLSESAESGDRFLVLGNVNHAVEVTGNNIPLNDTCAITLTNGGTFSSPSGNSFYGGYNGGVGSSKICNGAGSTNPAYFGGNLANHGIGPIELGSYVGFFAGNPGGPKSVFDSSTMTNAPLSILTSNGTPWLERGIFYAMNDNMAGYTPAASRTPTSTPCSYNTLCLDNGSHEVGGVPEVAAMWCSVTGTGVNGNLHVFYISGVDRAGNETILFPLYGSHCYNGVAVYDASHYETLTWTGTPGAATYNLYAGNPKDSSRVALVASGLTGTSYRFDGPYPLSWRTVGPPHGYNQTIWHAFRGSAVAFQYATPLYGFSDKGTTQKWSISSATGDASFARDLNIGRNVTVAGTLTAPGVARTIAIGTAKLGTAAIASGACASVVIVSATGVETTDVITFTPNADISAVTGYTPGGGLSIYPYPTAGAVNFKVCNGTATSVTPGAVTLNWRVAR